MHSLYRLQLNILHSTIDFYSPWCTMWLCNSNASGAWAWGGTLCFFPIGFRVGYRDSSMNFLETNPSEDNGRKWRYLRLGKDNCDSWFGTTRRKIWQYNCILYFWEILAKEGYHSRDPFWWLLGNPCLLPRYITLFHNLARWCELLEILFSYQCIHSLWWDYYLYLFWF